MSEIFDMVHISLVGNLAEVLRDFRDIISWAKQMAGNWSLEHEGSRKHVNDAKSTRASTTDEHRWHAYDYLCVGSRDYVTKVTRYLC